MISQIIFTLILITAIVMFTMAVRKISRNIKLGKPFDRTDRSGDRWKAMFMVAIGQSKMVKRPFAGILHIFVYLGFIIINIEVVEILIDGVAGTHRVLSFLGPLYTFLISCFEYLAVAVAVACAIFLIRRNIGRLKRFWSKEMTTWPRTDANIILTTEILLMCAFLTLDASDTLIQRSANAAYGGFPISNLMLGMFSGSSIPTLEFVEHFCWWFHIIGILAFLNYVPYSKHFHILLAFPNVYYSNLNPKGEFTNLESVTREIKLMLDPSSAPPATDQPAAPERFGAKDVFDLSGIQLMNAYSCTECGRCTSSCPANQTGKALSPRKIMMDTRDRLEEVGKNIDKNGKFVDDGKSLLFNYITPEEVWACTSCNACTEECPVNIDPLAIIVDLRRFLVMEQSAPPQELQLMMNNVENNGAPWQFPASDRLNWTSAL
ncbi:MAG TPA: 4Fe-4S dicluster domain-containing protein [Bacteroidia bacterium]|nr:4Fe-4S dicluster domain-containing protein [Bacteroidia bacterium]